MVPQGAGRVTRVKFAAQDLRSFPNRDTCDPLDAYPIPAEFEEITEDGLAGAKAAITHAYEEPGTYFASVLVTSSRSENPNDTFTQVRNIARVRIVVE